MDFFLYTCVIIVFVIIIIQYCKTCKKVESFLEFIHIPKNAGTTIENVANENNVKWGRFKPAHRDHSTNNKCTYWHTPPKYFGVDSFYKKDETFCVVRDPYDRLVSEFKYRNKNKATHTKEQLNAWIQEHLKPEYYNNGENNCHFIPQHEFVYDDLGNKTCDNILRFDSLTDDFNKLTKKHEIDVRLSDSRRDNVTPNSLSTKDLYEETKRVIRSIYKKDFDLLQL
jgi:hypothetical protein